MADGKQGGIQSIFKLSSRPQCDIVQKHDQTIDLEPEGLSTHVYVAECTNCQLVLKQKAGKVLIEKCQDLVLTMSAELVSGTLEIVKSSKICIKINSKLKIPTITADSTTGLQVILLEKEEQVESLYFHESSDLTITVQGEGVEKKEYVANPPADSAAHRQFIAHWVKNEDGVQLKTENVVREGVFPNAEGELKEALQRDKQNAEKAFSTLEKEYMSAKKK